MSRLIRIVGRIVGALFALMFVTNVVSAIAAVVARTKMESHGEPGSDDLDLVTIFGAREHRSVARAFRGGRSVTWYGATELDLREANLGPGGASLEAWTLWGSTILRLPHGWRVEEHVVPILGGVTSDAEDEAADPALPVLRVHGVALFGSLEIDVDRSAALQPAVDSPAPDTAAWPEVLPVSPA